MTASHRAYLLRSVDSVDGISPHGLWYQSFVAPYR
jgi:hypothetical protein